MMSYQLTEQQETVLQKMELIRLRKVRHGIRTHQRLLSLSTTTEEAESLNHGLSSLLEEEAKIIQTANERIKQITDRAEAHQKYQDKLWTKQNEARIASEKEKARRASISRVEAESRATYPYAWMLSDWVDNCLLMLDELQSFNPR